ncbi:MAG: c-type cytochrome [Candidatus Acidiferrales bacterium]
MIEAAIFFTAACLALIAYATWGLGINVPTCVPEAKAFDHGSITKHGNKNYEIHFLAKMWAFEPSRVRVPVGSTLDVYVTSKDVTHGFQIAGTDVNMMAEPAVITYARVHFEKPGAYAFICHEYCGAGHQNMSGMIEVSDQATDISAEGLPSPEAGRKILEEKGCLACHSVDGSPGVGPTFQGLWGQTVELSDGTTRKVDASFVREMILDPGKNPVKGFQPVMPQLPVTQDEIERIEDYLQTLNTNGTPN